jgi:alpha-amylase/alpha-mannosidase (GH57 family)
VEAGERVKTLHLAFLWHMHQPWYRDEKQGVFLMPWVFLHAIKDYAELPWIQSHYPGIHATYNLVPSLMTQLEHYAKDYKSDLFLALLAKDAASLTHEEKAELLEKGFFANPRTMIAPLWRYAELHKKRLRFEKAADAVVRFENGELNDLAVLFLLSWCGNQLRRENDTVKALIAKGANFTHKEKLDLLDALVKFCKTVLPLYKVMQEKGSISVFTTPFYHPILPLLLDVNAGRASDPHIAPPNRWSDFSEDAERHVTKAIEWYTGAFGHSPEGFWPAEGAVSNAALALLVKHGASYACTDEDVLFKSLPSPHYRIDLYKRFKVKTERGEIGMLFRDKAISDFIGFHYSTQPAQAAADDFIGRLRAIYDAVDFDAVVPVFLDGENAWEFYENNAFEFFNALYERISSCAWIKTVTIPEAHKIDIVPKVELASLQTGSWIYGTLGTWMGHSEKNRAWELLADAHNEMRAAYDRLDEETREKVIKEAMIAEGSDWFWWFGDDHFTELAAEFDEIFRGHIRNIYLLLGQKPHPAVNERIKRVEIAADHTPQSAPISPSVDGKRTDYFEWIGAGKVDLCRSFSTMDTSATLIKNMLYGTDGEYFYFQLAGNIEPIKAGGYELQVDMRGKHTLSRRVRLSTRPITDEGLRITVHSVLEVAIKAPLKSRSEHIEIEFLLYCNETPIQHIPLYNTLTLKLPDFDALWYI